MGGIAELQVVKEENQIVMNGMASMLKTPHVA